MAKQYIDSKAGKKKSAKRVAWVLVAMGLIFIYVVIKFATTGSLSLSGGGLPTGEQAYEVAQGFVKSTVRSSSIDFPESGYYMAKRNDSTYVIRTTAEVTSDEGDKKRTKFKILMEYKGGKQDQLKNWSLLNISEE
jgi:hypothetical protein